MVLVRLPRTKRVVKPSRSPGDHREPAGCDPRPEKHLNLTILNVGIYSPGRGLARKSPIPLRWTCVG